MTSFISLGALRTFVEVGRQGSIKRAAQELNVTPGAVSQRGPPPERPATRRDSGVNVAVPWRLREGDGTWG